MDRDAYQGVRASGRIKKVRTAHGIRSKRPRPRENWTRKDDAHPAIIPRDLWERVQRRREANATSLRESGFLGATRRTQTRYLLTCGACRANFIVRAVRNTRFGRYHYYGCAYHARRGTAVCPNRTLLPQDDVERELLEIMQREILTPTTLDRVLAAVNARLRAQATAVRPRVRELQRALAQVEREIGNYTRAVARGDFASLERALAGAEQRRASLQAELAQVTGRPQPAAVQLTPAALERHLRGLTEKLRSGMTGRVREAIEQSVARIVVGVDGSLTIEATPGGLLGVEDLPLDGPGLDGDPMFDHLVAGPAGRTWRVIDAPPDRSD